MGSLDVTVVVPWFGDLHTRLAVDRALPSAFRAFGDHAPRVIGCTGDTVAGARQNGLDGVETEWVVFLDADDELTPGYLEAMATGTADVRAPAVEYYDHTGPVVRHIPAALWRKDRFAPMRHHRPPYPESCLCSGNWVPIGSMVRADLLRAVGGWRDFPWSEDWDLWLRCHLAGASFEQVPKAVYRAHTMPGGRNQATREVRNAAHRAIAAANGVESTR